ncbi:MAG: hypothetical protein LBU40_06115, partial [Methanobrevibacter sp.]|nr:hypothetical protein [Methanobrevibacter sp.]
MGLFDTWDDIFNEDISNLDKYNDVNRIEQIITLMKGFRKNKFYKDLANIDRLGKKSLLASDNNLAIDFNKTPKFKMVKKGLGRDYLPFYLPPLTRTINFSELMGMYANISTSYVYSSGHRLTVDENKAIIFGDIGERVTFFVEDFEKDEKVPEYNIEFFKKLKKIKFENKRTTKLMDDIYNIDTSISAEFSLPSIFSRTMLHGSIYIMGCNALKNGREVITCDDVVVAYLTTFKI